MTDKIHEAVRRHYSEAARQVLGSSPQGDCSCGRDTTAAAPLSADPQQAESCCGEPTQFGSALYSALEQGELPGAAVMASLGCGNPVAVAELREGERVLDLGSGGGIDVLLSARRVGPTGKAYGLDMTAEMLALAAANAAEAGVSNVEWLKGNIEAIPLPGDSIDVVISNCVVNLAADKPAVFREIARVLRPGGRIGITDIVADDNLTAEQRAERGSYVGCIAGALSFAEFRSGLEAVGLTDVSLTVTHAVADGMYSAIVRAHKPAAATASAAPGSAAAGSAAARTAAAPLDGVDPREPPVTSGNCCG
jgi:SAM-dependent methyltransferase